MRPPPLATRHSLLAIASALAFAALQPFILSSPLTAAGAPPASTKLPPHPWGVYAWGGNAEQALKSIPAGIPVRGIPIGWRWKNLEPEQGKYAFDQQVRALLEALKRKNLYTHIMLWVAPETPRWLYEQAGVPEVKVPTRIAPSRKVHTPTYPYYLDPRYKEILHTTVKALADYIARLPEDLKSRIIFIQVAEGATGDGQPYKGEPIDKKYRITTPQWNEYRRATWAYYQTQFQRPDGSLNIPILVNGDANTPVENQWLLDNCDNFGVKQGMFSHGYLVSDSIERLANREAFRAEALARGHKIFTRGEQDEEWNVCGWSKQNPPAAFYWSALFALHCKLDVWNIPTDALASKSINEETVRLFNRYAGHNEPAASPVAFCALHRALNAADTTAFPVDKYGEALKTNTDRYLAIAKEYAPCGARQGDPDKAIGGGMKNRQADDQNDVGWNVIPGNYERHLTQLRPEETSLALWHLDKHPYSQFVRRFDAASGRTTMTFRIADKFFAAPSEPTPMKIRVAYLDKGAGAWELLYATPGGEKTARRVTNTNSGKWRDITLTLTDAVWDHRLPGGGDLALRHAGGDDTIFHIIELERHP